MASMICGIAISIMRSAKLTVDDPIASAIPTHHLYDALSRDTANCLKEITLGNSLTKTYLCCRGRNGDRLPTQRITTEFLVSTKAGSGQGCSLFKISHGVYPEYDRRVRDDRSLLCCHSESFGGLRINSARNLSWSANSYIQTERLAGSGKLLSHALRAPRSSIPWRMKSNLRSGLTGKNHFDYNLDQRGDDSAAEVEAR
jgi:hypothetical protein